MPSRLVLKKFRAGKLRSGNKRTGPKVKSLAQARAIQISEARKEGHNIPKKSRRKRTSRVRRSRTSAYRR
jgi:hypothetical protein